MAKDKHDSKTQPLNLSRQAAYRQRMQDKGYRQKNVWLHTESYEQGQRDAAMGSTNASDGSTQAVCIQSYFLGYGQAIEKQRKP